MYVSKGKLLNIKGATCITQFPCGCPMETKDLMSYSNIQTRSQKVIKLKKLLDT